MKRSHPEHPLFCSKMSTERPAKRLRANVPTTLDEVRNCYLDTVPDEILRIVLRYLLRRPQHENWHAYLSARLVDTALHMGGALERAALVEFHRIGVSMAFTLVLISA